VTATAVLPAPYHVRTLLEDLLGRPVDVEPGPPWAPLHGEPGTLALYVDDDFVLRALGVCDLQFSAYAGAAIGLVPRPAAHTAVKARRLDKETQENLDEVLDICAGLYNGGDAPTMRLHRVYHIGGDVAPQVRALSAVLGRRLDLSVRISGYGSGRLSFVAVV
jgi:hypothetical protein